MFRNRKQRPRWWDAHIVDNGNVRCPRLAQDVDLDQCLVCPSLKDLSSEQGLTYVMCRPPRRIEVDMMTPVF